MTAVVRVQAWSMSQRLFRVPKGLTLEGDLVDHADAEKSKTYLCPNPRCRSPLLVREGLHRRKHFCHRPSANCSPETVLHWTAKLLVASLLNDWNTGAAPAPEVLRQCCQCENRFWVTLPRVQLDEVIVEHELPNGRVVDVALIAEGKARAAIEIRVSHAVDDAKKAALKIPWIELAGEDVIASPQKWQPLHDQFRSAHCADCKHAAHVRAALELQRRQEGARLEEALRIAGFDAKRFPEFRPWRIVVCERCGTDVPTYRLAGRIRSAPRCRPINTRIAGRGSREWIETTWGRRRGRRVAHLIVVSLCPNCAEVIDPTR